jgi:hypothetical protein
MSSAFEVLGTERTAFSKMEKSGPSYGRWGGRLTEALDTIKPRCYLALCR